MVTQKAFLAVCGSTCGSDTPCSKSSVHEFSHTFVTLLWSFFFFLFQFFAVGIYFLWLVQSVKLQSFFFSFHSFKKENYLGSKLPHLQPPCTFD